jgi:hypothetical protein
MNNKIPITLFVVESIQGESTIVCVLYQELNSLVGSSVASDHSCRCRRSSNSTPEITDGCTKSVSYIIPRLITQICRRSEIFWVLRHEFL